LSVAIAFACLEVVLDRGQTLDWFESNFIVVFFAVAMVGAAVCDCVGVAASGPGCGNSIAGRSELCAGEYFLLFVRVHAVRIHRADSADAATIVWGTRRTDAGLVLGPGAFVIVMLAPVVVRILPKLGVKRLGGIRVFRVCASDVVFRELHAGDGLPA